MSEPRFPKRREDGSFSLLIRFSTSDETIRGLVLAYLQAWVRANQTWVRIWRSDSIEEERLEFGLEFSENLSVEADARLKTLTVVLEGKATARRWKDWAAFLVNDLSTVFPELRFEGLDS